MYFKLIILFEAILLFLNLMYLMYLLLLKHKYNKVKRCVFDAIENDITECTKKGVEGRVGSELLKEIAKSNF